MNAKIIILFILSLVMGIAFVVTGMYFLSKNKGIGYTALSLGAITIVWGIFVFMFPALAPVLALIYMIILIAAFSVIMLIFK